MKDMRDFVRSEFALKTKFFQALLTLCFGAFGMVPLAGLAVAQESAPFTVEADELLEWDQAKGTYRATGNAVARQEDQQIRAMELVASYDTSSESRKITLIVATGAVEYEDGTSTARGDKLTYYIDAERYLIEGAKSLVTGPNGTMRASKSIELLSPTPDKQLLTAIGTARYTDAEGQIVEGETINAHLDADGALDVLDAKDKVKVVSVNGQVATGDAVTYNQKTSKALLTGNVEILDSGNVMRGSRAEVDFDSGISRILSDGSGKRVSGTLQPQPNNQ